MPPLPTIAGVVEVQEKLSDGNDNDVLLKWYLGYAGPAPTNAQCLTLATAIDTGWDTNCRPLYANTTKHLATTCIDLSSHAGGVGTYTESIVGTRAGTAMPAGVATLINFKIARRYRGGKPRVYAPFGVTADINDSQTWSAGFVTSVGTGWAAYIAAAVAAPWTGATLSGQVNVSYYQGHASVQNPVTLRWRNYSLLRAGGPIADTITSVVVNPKYGSQRRRNLHSV